MLVDLLPHLLLVLRGDDAIALDGGVWVMGETNAVATLLLQAIAGACNVLGLARRVDMRTEALFGVGRARDIRLGGVVRNLAVLVDPVVRPVVVAAQTAA